MSEETNLAPLQAKSNDAVVSAIARETAIPVDKVRDLYEREVATLSKRATIRKFVGVIATKRVKQQLRSGRAA